MRSKVVDVMTSPPIAVTTEVPFKRIAEILRDNEVTALPVMDADGHVVGVVSEGDLMLKEERAELESHPGLLQSRQTRAARGKAAGKTAGDLMTSPAIVTRREAPVAEAARLMHRHGVKRLPVVDDEGRLLGVISRADLLRVFLRSDNQILREVVDELIVETLLLEPRAIAVDVRDGIVHVEGELERWSQLQALERLIPQVEGVVAVESHLTCPEESTPTWVPGSQPWPPLF